MVPLNQPEGTPNPPERFAPSLPTDGQELMAAWELPPEAWDRTTVKTTRFVRGTSVQELLASQTLADWNLEELARTFGPGTYRVQAGPGPYRTKNSTITVSREYADAAGFAAAPVQYTPPDPIQLQASRTFKEATQGPVDPINLAAMIQTAVNQALQQSKAQESGLDSFLKGFTVANDLSLKAMEQAKAMLGINPQPAEAREVGWPEVILQVAPGILGALQQAMKTPSQPAPATPQHPGAPAPVATLPHHGQTPHPTPTHNTGEPMQTANLPEPPPETIPLLQIMKNNAGFLRGPLKVQAVEDLANQLAGLIGPELDGSIIATADFVQANGPAILAHAAPDLATEKAAAVLIEWRKIITSQQPPED